MPLEEGNKDIPLNIPNSRDFELLQILQELDKTIEFEGIKIHRTHRTIRIHLSWGDLFFTENKINQLIYIAWEGVLSRTLELAQISDCYIIG
ncbi:hypothetical protein [Xenorhabdus stockiae]|uniref:hypothetical protein n=1 Tax=Xenorhabdus stockiae TaxID=351614 RepID=UPI004062B880